MRTPLLGKKDLGPLRKVVDGDASKDKLECGHVLPIAQDIYGPRFPQRRRCRKCRDGITVNDSKDGNAHG
jgi:hypothetical protein